MNGLSFPQCFLLSSIPLTMLHLHSIYKNQAENMETNGCQAGETTPSPQSRHHRKSSGVLLKLSY